MIGAVLPDYFAGLNIAQLLAMFGWLLVAAYGFFGDWGNGE